MRKFLPPIAAVALVIAVVFGLQYFLNKKGSNLKNTVITLYKSPYCGCCGNYVNYLRDKGYTVFVKEVGELEKIKEEKRVPAELQSCHTSFANGYIIEGHVPVEAIDKLLKEEPSIKGIALAGMPFGAPGMGGWKNLPLVVRIIDEDGQAGGVFIRL